MRELRIYLATLDWLPHARCRIPHGYTFTFWAVDLLPLFYVWLTLQYIRFICALPVTFLVGDVLVVPFPMEIDLFTSLLHVRGRPDRCAPVPCPAPCGLYTFGYHILDYPI